MATHRSWLSRLLHGPLPPRVPDGQCVYAIGDIHGHYDLLTELLGRIWADAGPERNTLVLLGDYVDRGPASKDVIECIMSLERPGWQIVPLKGNHDAVLLDYIKDPGVYQAWRSFGGSDTLLSYGVKPPMFSDPEELARAHREFLAAVPERHRAFLSGLATSHVIGDYVFVHAGLRPGVALQRQTAEDMLWIRDDFLSSDVRFDKIVVHGHSPSDTPVVRPNRIGVDTGAYATGRLTAVKLLGDTVGFLSAGGGAA